MPALSGVIFSFQFCLFFFNISLGRPHQHCGLGLLFVLIRNIGHRTLPNIWVGTFLVRNVHSREKTELILTVKMETKHPIEGPFTSEFPAICYFVNFVSNFCVFSENRSLLNYRYCADRAQNLPGASGPHLANTLPDLIQMGSLSAELLPNA